MEHACGFDRSQLYSDEGLLRSGLSATMRLNPHGLPGGLVGKRD